MLAANDISFTRGILKKDEAPSCEVGHPSATLDGIDDEVVLTKLYQ